MTRFFCCFDVRNAINRSGGQIRNAHCIGFRLKLRLFAVKTIEFGFECTLGKMKFYCDRPILFRHEIKYLALSVANEFCRNRLHTARRKSSSNLCPKQRADFVAEQTVKHAPRLLRINKVPVNAARIFDRLLNDCLCDFVKHNTTGLVFIQLQHFCKMPRNRFSLAIRVGCKHDMLCVLCFFAYFFDNFASSAKGNIFGFKVVFNINTKLAFRQIANMPVRCNDPVF